MVSKRLLKINEAANIRSDRQRPVKFKQRVKQLRVFEGWYPITYFNRKHPVYMNIRLMKEFGNESLSDKNIVRKYYKGMRLGKYLINKLGQDSDMVADFMAYIQTESIKLSCRYNDILRVADTPHYRTCMGSWRGIQLLRNLADPDMCVIYLPDKAGNMRCRCFGRLLLNKNNDTVLGLYRVYGNGFNHDSLSDIFPIKTVSLKTDSSYYDYDLRSYSKVYNPAVKKPVWSDHTFKYNEDIHRMLYVTQ